VISCIERGVGRVTRVLLDNMVVRMPNGDVDVSMLQSAVDLVNSRFETEASGNVTIETVGRIGSTGVTYISRYRNKNYLNHITENYLDRGVGFFVIMP
jgi:nicotinate-nucleotide pyrophosphorylase